MPTLTARGAGEEHSGMKLIAFPSTDNEVNGGGVKDNGKHKKGL